jgi:hypothetical protein
MKETNKLKLGLAMMLCVVTALVWSCKDEAVDLTASRSKFVLDSLALVDSLARAKDAQDRKEFISDRSYDSLVALNQAGLVTYAINVVDGSASSISNGRTESTQTLVTGASVTVSQFGRTQTLTTTANGMAVFSGLFRNGLNVTITKAGFTSANYIVAVKNDNATPNGQKGFVGNIIPIFPTTGANTATISGRMTIQTDLTNKTRELVPDGTTVLVGIDATGTGATGFRTKFLADGISANLATVLVTDNNSKNTENYFYVGDIKQANYETGVVGSTTAGIYTVTVPAAFDGLPLSITASEIAADQKLYETAGVIPGDRTSTYRTLFGPGISPSTIPAGSAVTVGFAAFTTAATATASVSSSNGAIDKINITAGGKGYSGTPVVQISGGGGTGASATATVVNGVVTGVTVTSPGSGYSSPTVSFLEGTGASATVNALEGTQTVVGVAITNTGSGYTTAPTVTFTLGGGTTQATGTAVITNGKVTSVTVLTAGAGYTGTATVTFSGGTPTTPATGNAIMSGQSIGDITVTAGSGYTFPPAVTFEEPSLLTGTRATGVAIINALGNVIGIQVTNAGSGYTVGQFPISVTLATSTSPATAEAFTTGGSIISVDIATNGAGYVGTPAVVFAAGGGGTGAAGTAVMANGKVVGVTITNPGTGYTSAPNVTFASGDGAVGYATVVNGVITAITVSDGGFGWTEAPRVSLTASTGGGATATATVVGGSITGVTVTAGGTGYVEGNLPGGGNGDAFSGTTTQTAKPGLKYIIDVYYGTGNRQPN